MTRGVVLGAIATLVALGLVLYIGVEAGLMPANADAKPSKLERWAARTSLHATLAREASTAPPPVVVSDANLVAGRAGCISVLRSSLRTASKTIPRA